VPATNGIAEMEALLGRAHYDPKRGAYFAALSHGEQAELTLNHDLQVQFEKILKESRLEAGAIVALDPRTGRILGIAETNRGPKPQPVALKAAYPAASVFKIVTAAALLEAGVDPEREVCFHGGMHRLLEKNLVDDPRRDGRCASMALAMGKSLNAVFGKLAERDLDPTRLRSMADRFFFNHPLPFVAEASEGAGLVSPATIPDEPFAFGQTAAGFGKVFLSPLHGAVLAGIVGNGGVAAAPRLVNAVWTDGTRQPEPAAHAERVIPENIAAELGQMMRLTVSEGTARKAFRVGRRWALGDVPVAGKTGTLADKAPYKDYSWFVGYAPANDPTIAIAVMAQNGMKWTVRAPVVARQALQAHFDAERDHRRHASR
jgi:cell division protein FtsI/penicillin-binding protein 2